jgi:hypothetical protein
LVRRKGTKLRHRCGELCDSSSYSYVRCNSTTC